MNDHNGKTVGYSYDEVGNQTEIVYPDNSVVKYQYDSLKRMTEVIDSDSTTKYSFDKAGRITRLAYANSLYEEYTYDPSGQLLRVYCNDDKNRRHLQNKYAYDPQGNVISDFKRDVLGDENQNIKYGYDKLNRLVGAKEESGMFARNYQYDSLGNMVFENDDVKKDSAVSYSVDGLNRLVEKSVDGKEAFSFVYDKRGNQIKEINKNNNAIIAEYLYDATNRMVKGVNTERGSSVYNFNGLGVLVQNEFITEQKINKDYVVDYTAYVPRELTEYDSEGIDFKNIYGYKKISADINSNDQKVKMFYHNDRLGTVVNATDIKGKIQARADYDEWGNRGNVLTAKVLDDGFDLVKNYAGHNLDGVVGVYYAKARIYDSSIKSFLGNVTNFVLKENNKSPLRQELK